MKWMSLENVWKAAGSKQNLKVRFNDWSQTVKYFSILRESTDGRRYLGELDSGEKVSYFKSSKGWSEYTSEDELSAHAV